MEYFEEVMYFRNRQFVTTCSNRCRKVINNVRKFLFPIIIIHIIEIETKFTKQQSDIYKYSVQVLNI